MAKTRKGYRSAARVVVAGMAVAGVAALALRARSRSEPEVGARARRADGSNDDASFAAQIADEGSIPDVLPEPVAAEA